MLIGIDGANSERLYSGSSVGGRAMSRCDQVGADAVNGPGEPAPDECDPVDEPAGLVGGHGPEPGAEVE